MYNAKFRTKKVKLAEMRMFLAELSTYCYSIFAPDNNKQHEPTTPIPFLVQFSSSFWTKGFSRNQV